MTGVGVGVIAAAAMQSLLRQKYVNGCLFSLYLSSFSKFYLLFKITTKITLHLSGNSVYIFTNTLNFGKAKYVETRSLQLLF